MKQVMAFLLLFAMAVAAFAHGHGGHGAPAAPAAPAAAPAAPATGTTCTTEPVRCPKTNEKKKSGRP